MVISVSNNISEVSINEFFHNAEISVLNICHEMEMYNARCEFLNEAESEQKKDSVFKKFVETIKQKAIELFNKAYQSILSIYNNFYAKKNKKAAEKVSSKDVANYMYSKITKNDLVLYDTLNMKVDIDQTDLKTVQDFMDSFKIDKSASKNEIEKAIQGSTNNRSSIKLLNDEKKSFLDDINKQYKDGSIGVEEKTAKIKLLMNRYTAELKCQVHNNKTYISVINEMIKSGPISDKNNRLDNNDSKPKDEFDKEQSNQYKDNSSNDTKSKQNEDSNKDKSQNNDSSNNDKDETDGLNIIDFNEFKKYVEEEDIDQIFYMIADYVEYDYSGKSPDFLVKYAEKRIPGLFTKFVVKDKYERYRKNNPRLENKSDWTKAYLNRETTKFATCGRTRDQYNHIKKVAKYLHGKS